MSEHPVRGTRNSLLICLALWALFSVYAMCNLSHIALVVHMTVDQKDTAEIYYSPTGQWNENESVRIPIEPGGNETIFWLPGLLSGDSIRFDPGMLPQSYRIASMTWISTASDDFPVPLSKVQNLHSQASTLSSADGLQLTALDNDPQLGVPTPPLTTRIWAARWPFLASLSGLAALFLFRWRRWQPYWLAALYVGSAAIFYFFACLIVGPRVPMFDDWRYVIPSRFDLVDGGWQWLGAVGNDTYFLTNQVFDFIVLKLTNVDFLALRGFSVTVLLAQLTAQFIVIRRVLGATQGVAAIAVGLCIWSLTSNTYWSMTTIAYQQALPTFFGTLLLLRLISPDGNLRDRPGASLIVLASLASGLSYISGGMLLLSLGIAYLAACDWPRATLRRFSPGYTIGGMGLFLLVLQFTLVIIQQGSLLEHNHHSESVYPTDHRFWLFFFALFGRAAGYDGVSVPMDIFLCAIVLIPTLALAVPKVRSRLRAHHSGATMLALYAGIGAVTYAAIVSFGRAGFAAATEPAAVVTGMGKGRFHYWPIAAMLPFVWVGWYLVLSLLPRIRVPAMATVAALLLAPKSLPVMDHVSFLRQWADVAKDGAQCAVAHEQRAPGSSLVCTSLTGAPADIGVALEALKARNSPTYRELMREGATSELNE